MLKKILMVFFMSMVPVVELRGSIPVGVAAGLEPWLATLVAILGNLVPVPFILLFIQKILDFLRQDPNETAKNSSENVKKSSKTSKNSEIILKKTEKSPNFWQKSYQKLYKSLKIGKIVKKLDEKVEKNRGKIEKYGIPGLILLVAIPIPGTGAWTGSLVAGMLELDRKKSFAAIAAGVVIAGLIFFVATFAAKSAVS